MGAAHRLGLIAEKITISTLAIERTREFVFGPMPFAIGCWNTSFSGNFLARARRLKPMKNRKIMHQSTISALNGSEYFPRQSGDEGQIKS